MGKRICMGCMEKYDEKYDVCPYCGYMVNTPPREAYHLVPGTILHKRYIVGRVIGYGGFGVTYLGYDAMLDMKIAIKEYLPGEFGTRAPGTSEVTVFSGDKEEQFRNGIVKFVDEAKRLAQFNGISGIVSVFDSFEENNTAYIIMEYLQGETLKTMLEREGRMDVNYAIAMMLPIISALKEVHKKSIIHRDISPDNIFITNSGDVKLIDFGAARYATTTHSKSLSVIVKPGYAPQEQYRSRGDQGPWTDVYACAATLYKMITGVTPEDSMERGTKDTLVPPSKLGVDIPKNKENAIMNALNLEIEDRTESMEAFEADLTTDEEVIRNKVRHKRMDIGKWPLWLKITSGAAAAAIATIAVLLLTGVINWGSLNIFDKRTKVYVPNVGNCTQAEAEEAIGQIEGLIYQTSGFDYSDAIPEGMVISQNIPAGTEVEVGENGMLFEVVISKGEEKLYMPDVEGLSKEEAQEILEAMGFFVVFENEESEIAPGYICRQQYEENEELKKGTEITLYVSTGDSSYNGSEMTKIPNTVGVTWIKARQKAANKKVYIYKTSTREDESIEKNIVISQDKEAKTEVPVGTTFGVTVSLGIIQVRVPDVVGTSLEDATSLIEKNGLIVSVTYEESDTVKKGVVMSQSIEAGTEVDSNTTLTIVVSSGSEKTNSAETYEPSTSSKSTTEEDDEYFDGESENEDDYNEYDEDEDYYDDDENTTESKKQTTQAATTEAPTTETKTTEAPTTETKTTEAAPTTTEDTRVTVPSVVGKTESNAKSAISGVGLTVGNITYMSSSVSSTGTVLSQGTASGSKVDAGTSITLIVCDNSTKTQYRYRSISIDYKESTSSTMSGYTRYDSKTTTSYGSWGSWSSWSSTSRSKSETQDVESESGALFGRYLYGESGIPYWVQADYNSNGYLGEETVYFPYSWMVDGGYKYTSSTRVWYLASSYSSYNAYPTLNPASNGLYQYYRNSRWSWSGTVYRYRTRSKTTTTIYYFKKTVYGSWSSWSDAKVTATSIRDVETRTVNIYDAYN